MWYFAWLLGVLLACSFGIINVMWLEFHGTWKTLTNSRQIQ
jgi:cyd operon protein YbgT